LEVVMLLLYLPKNNIMLITKTTHISHNKVWLNDQVVYQQEPESNFQDFIKPAFKELCTPYPKFYKMDSLSKLAYVASEVLLKDTDLLSKYSKEEIGLVFLNSTSTINTDREHQKSVSGRANYFPSPAIFVYTLPNIMLGEICIKNGFFGENLLLVSEKFDAEMLHRQVKQLHESQRLQACITGWVDIDEDNYQAFIMLAESDSIVDNSKEFCTFDVATIEKLFNR